MSTASAVAPERTAGSETSEQLACAGVRDRHGASSRRRMRSANSNSSSSDALLVVNELDPPPSEDHLAPKTIATWEATMI